MHRECDGSCLVQQLKSEEIKFEDGTSLFFYYCRHEKTHVLTNYPGLVRTKGETKTDLDSAQPPGSATSSHP
jgi:hypothetical protein